MTRTERVLRDLLTALGHAEGCDECVSPADALCSTRHFNKFKRAVNDARRVVRQLDREREEAKKKPN